MSKKENNNNKDLYPFNGYKSSKIENYKLHVFDKYSKDNIGLVNGKSQSDCLRKAHELFDESEFIFSFNANSELRIKEHSNPKLLYIFHEDTLEHCNTIVGKTKKECWDLAGELLNNDSFDVTFDPRFGQINGIESTQTNCYLYAY